ADARARLRREHVLLSQIGPPWVPRVFELTDDHLVMELVELPTLAHRMAELAPLAAPALATLVEPLLATVGHLHASAIVHRDLKPENIFLDATRAVVIDFGLARAANDPALTSSSVGAGTA